MVLVSFRLRESLASLSCALMVEIAAGSRDGALRRSNGKRPQSTQPALCLMLRAPVTIPMVFVQSMLSGAQARGLSCEALLADAGIAPELLAQAAARVTSDQYVALFRLLMDRLDDECLGFLTRPLKCGSLALMTRSAISAGTLERALHRVAHTFRLLQDDVLLEPVREGALAGVALHFTHPTAAYPPFTHELLLRVFWRVLAWLAGGRL